MPITMERATTASNPGKLKISTLKLKRYFELNSIDWFFIYICSLLPKKQLAYLYKKNKLAQIFVNYKEAFLYGCLNPAKVVNRQKSLVAVYTDLSAYETGPYYVIKIYKERLFVLNQFVNTGDKVSTVAIYEGEPTQYPAHWTDFHPTVLECFCSNRKECKRAFDSIPNEEWLLLEEGLKTIPQLEEGLYFFE